MNHKLDLNKIRPKLIGLENTILFNILERAQFKLNSKAYSVGGIPIEGCSESFFDFLFKKIEIAHALAGRYRHAEEYPFNKDLPDNLTTRTPERVPVKRINLDINPRIRNDYFELLKKICESGEDKHPGSSAVCDIACLQAISYRVHIGAEVAQAKYDQDPREYQKLIETKDIPSISEKLTNGRVEDMILSRIERRARDYQLEEAFQLVGKEKIRKMVDPKEIVSFYKDTIIPLTKEVEIAYFLESFQE